jgi:hypothetical protein
MADFDQLEKENQLELICLAKFNATATDDAFKNGREYHVMRACFYIEKFDIHYDVLLGARILPRKTSEVSAASNLAIFTENKVGPKVEVANTTNNANGALREKFDFGLAISVFLGFAVTLYQWGCDMHALNLSLVNGCYAAYGIQGDMFHANVLQLAFKIGYVLAAK